MGRFQTIVSNGAGSRGGDVNNGSPSFQLVVAGSMKDISRADGNSRTRRLDRRKCRVIIHRFVGQKDLLPPAPPHVQRRKVVQRSGSACAGEQPQIGPIPEPMLVRLFDGNSGRVLFGSRCHRHVLRPTNGQKKCRAAESKSD